MSAEHPIATPVSLDDKWDAPSGPVLLSGAQTLARIMLSQAALDRARGWRTAGYVSGYRGSPLGNVDSALWSAGARLSAADIVFQPAVNEDAAATAVHGTQQIDAVPDPLFEGVFAAWYGKGPGVDRSGDALKHGNYAGAHPRGGVLVFYGDDHAAKSSTVAHQSEQALAAHLIPSLYPANVQELFDFGLLGFALSRYAGAWIGVKCVNEVAEQTATVEIDGRGLAVVEPPFPDDLPADARGPHGAFNPVRDEQLALEHRLPLVHAFVRANNVDQVRLQASAPRLGVVTAGKTYGDVMAALALLGLDRDTGAGISVYKVGLIWPLEPQGVAAFAAAHEVLLVIEEKKNFLEDQVAAAIINAASRPRVIGKRDEDGRPLLSPSLPLPPVDIARAIAGRLERLGLATEAIRRRVDALETLSPADPDTPMRAPFFCSGCPHSRSTRLPEGSISMTGIGCHTMVALARPQEALPPVQMGGEGVNWLGIAPFTKTRHIFQNLGDGTYYHSGLLAIRAAVAAGANITYKILYNDAVAMTGGQPVDGPLSPAAVARQVLGEGVKRVVLLSDDPTRHQTDPELPAGVTVGHRDTLDAVQRELREAPGCTVLIYEQTCAIEKRRRRKRGEAPDPPKRLHIARAVCEGCGDCSTQSTCVSLVPVETEFGRKRAIDQSSCNKDYSCLQGFCPAFVTVHGGQPRRPRGVQIEESLFATLPPPPCPRPGDRGYNIMVAGIGGSGVVTVGAILGMAAHIDGLAVSLFDLTGLSQKNGAVFSHVRIAATPRAIANQRIGQGEADLLMAFDLIAALAPEAATTLSPARTRALANAAVAPTVAFQFDRNVTADPALLLRQIEQRTGQELLAVDAARFARALLGDSIGANLFMVGVAAQRGLLPIGLDAIEQAIRLNAVAVGLNLSAFRLGRLYAARPEATERMAAKNIAPPPQLPTTLDEILASRGQHLIDYQGEPLARRYRALVERVRSAEAACGVGDERLARVVARAYARLLAYKDEYEVARLLTSAALRHELERGFEGGRLAFNLAPPLLAGAAADGRPRKHEFGAWILPPLRVLAGLRGLRGTPFDPFGATRERRLERDLIGDYEALVEGVLDRLSRENHPAAVVLLGAVDEVRGYGPVKLAALEAYRANLPGLEAAFQAAGATALPASLVKAG